MESKSLWQLLWDYDPNGLVVTDADLNIKVVNAAFCRMFRVNAEAILGTPAASVLGDVDDFRTVWRDGVVIHAKEKDYPGYDLHVRKVLFPIQAEGVVACIIVDLTHEWKQQEDLRQLRRETIEKVNQVVDNQMKVAQEIAGLLGEVTAETKVSLRRLIELVDRGED
jgi:PAS domain-containing protein